MNTEYLTTEELAQRLRMAPQTLRAWRHAHKGPASLKLGGKVLYAVEDVEAFIAEARTGTPAA